MKILDVLNEGLIRVPETAFKQAVSVVLSAYFSRLMDVIDTEKRGIVNKRISSLAGYADIELYSIDSSHNLTNTIFITKDQLPANYKKFPKTKMTIFSGQSVETEYDTNTREIFVSIPNDNLLKQVNQNIKLLDVHIRTLIANTRHELMHAVQDLSFREKFSSIDYVNKDKSIDMDKYTSHPLEYQPLIVTHANDFIGHLKKSIKKISSIPQDQLIKMVKQYASPTGKVHFFVNIYKKDKNLWKKAVREFYREIIKEIESEEEI